MDRASLLLAAACAVVLAAASGCASSTLAPLSQSKGAAVSPTPAIAPPADAAPATEEQPSASSAPSDSSTAGAGASAATDAAPAAEAVAAPATSPASPEKAAKQVGEAEAKAAPAAPGGATAAATTAPRTPAPQPTARYLSADDSNSQASPVVARKLITGGRAVHPDVVRTYEFLNYYTFDYPAPTDGDLAIYAEMAPAADQGHYTLQIALRSRDRARGDLPPLALTVLVDASGSMAGEPLELAKRFILGLAGRLRPGDTISVVACARSARVLADRQPAGVATTALLRDTILPSLTANDVTDLEQGIRAAYEVAERSYQARALNRVVLVSDGAANAGELAVQTIAKQAEDADRQGIYLAGVGVGEGFNDWLMNKFTDSGRGAYLFLDSAAEIDHDLDGAAFVSNFDLALKDVRLKLVLPPGWEIEEFHGEQMSAVASDVVPQYLAPGDQMIYHLAIKGPGTPEDVFEIEAEYRPLGGKPTKAGARPTVLDMLRSRHGIAKGDAVVAYAEALKKIALPLADHVDANRAALAKARETVSSVRARASDPELDAIIALLDTYDVTATRGEQLAGARDKGSTDLAAVLGIPADTVKKVAVTGAAPAQAVAPLERLLNSTRLVPQEGYRFLAISTGPVGNPSPEGSGQLSGKTFANPAPEFMGSRRVPKDTRTVYDLEQVTFTLQAPPGAKSFSFDFDFFSAEYPSYVQQSYNDTFYAILSSPSTNGGKPTNIAFDANGDSIEVDNNYFEQPFHPIPNTDTGFDRNGSTGWLRTSWPIAGGERFSITFSVHDEGDAVFDSLVLLDNFRFHDYEAVGNTDPLN
jgi:Ca-activated chloride channel homolog